MAFDPLTSNAVSDYVLGAALGSLIALGIFILILIILAVYVYYSLALYTIAKKLKHKKPWLAWIPFANISLTLQLGNFHWAWVFLMLIPVAGWIAIAVLTIISKWRFYEKRNYPGWYSLAIVLPYAIGCILDLIAFGFVAWKDKKKRR